MDINSKYIVIYIDKEIDQEHQIIKNIISTFLNEVNLDVPGELNSFIQNLKVYIWEK
jgi:hypothetical protein